MAGSSSKQIFEEIFRKHLKIETYGRSISTLLGPRLSQRINYKPHYQRNYVWDEAKATYFIESILLGTEIPPLVFFKGRDGEIEIIDGRQRYETIKLFNDNELVLKNEGLQSLLFCEGKKFEDLDEAVARAFSGAKIRIIEFEIIIREDLDELLEDQVKKEIFARYNTGITPLRRSEVEYAIYDSDKLTKFIEKKLKDDVALLDELSRLFLRRRRAEEDRTLILKNLLSRLRVLLVLYKYPIKFYARNSQRNHTIEKLYDQYYKELSDPESFFSSFVRKIELVSLILSKAKTSLGDNRLLSEGYFWAFSVIEEELSGLQSVSENDLDEVARLADDNVELFSEEGSHFYSPVIRRYKFLAEAFEAVIGTSFATRIDTDQSWRAWVDSNQDKQRGEEHFKKATSFDSLRVTKPDPSKVPIDDIISSVQGNEIAIRPSYQRTEVINPQKASKIIESILLGVILPAIFVFKRKDGVIEVIDGQQRLLTVLGFLGEKYKDENGTLRNSKNHNFRLRDLKILKELNGLCFADLSDEQKEKLLSFDFYVVEIDERVNDDFDPVDLFVRLNEKPYPIKEHSFEMWNSWADRDIVLSIKTLSADCLEWFYLRATNTKGGTNRMENEELLTSLAFLEVKLKEGFSKDQLLDIHARGSRIGVRLRRKQEISSSLESALESEEDKQAWLRAIEKVQLFVKRLSDFIDHNGHLPRATNRAARLNELMNLASGRRTLKDLYLVWLVFRSAVSNSSFNLENHQLVTSALQDIFTYVREVPDDFSVDSTEQLADMLDSVGTMMG